MTRPVTCTVCGKMMDNTDSVVMPNGTVCCDCYSWLERMIEEGAQVDIEIEFDEDDEDDDDDD